VRFIFAGIFVYAMILGAVLLHTRKKRTAKRRLTAIRNDGTKSPQLSGKKTALLTKESFEKSKLSSNQQLSQVMLTVSNELEAAGLGDDPIRVILVWIIIVIVIPMIENLLGVRILVLVLTAIISAIAPLVYIIPESVKLAC
jgi:Flp pilus assembly protein TadB